MNDITEMQKNLKKWKNYEDEYDETKYKDNILGIVDILGFSQFVQNQRSTDRNFLPQNHFP